MEKYYYLSKTLISFWEQDLDLALKDSSPSEDVIDAIMDYALATEIYSPTLQKTIVYSFN
ncbi:MAG: hypothetical protein IJ250_00895 [Bacteroidales bacterium]|nr:hypothetical protein [Bacteroidales bacterium]MBQ7984175.1 hypothetical protein [Bacteroidales bacterium]